MKKIISLYLAFTIFVTLLCGFTAFADNSSASLVLQIGSQYMIADGQQVQLDAAPILHNGRTMLPIRAVVEALGGTVGWDGATQQITINIGSTQILMWLNNQSVSVNGQYQTMDVAPFTMNARTLVPVRFVSDNIPGYQTNWDGNTQSVYISPVNGGKAQDPVETKQGFWKLSRVIENPDYKREYKNENSGSTETIKENPENTDTTVNSYIWTFNYADHWCSDCGHNCGENGEHVGIGLSHTIPKDSYAEGENVSLNLQAFIASRTTHSCLRIGTEITAGITVVNADNIYYKAQTMQDAAGEGYTGAKITNGGYNDIHTGESYGETRTVYAKTPENCKAGDKVYIVVTAAPTSSACIELAYEYVWTIE